MRAPWYLLDSVEKSASRIFVCYFPRWTGAPSCRCLQTTVREPQTTWRAVGMVARVGTPCHRVTMPYRHRHRAAGDDIGVDGAAVHVRGATIGVAPCTVCGVPLLGPPHPRCYRSCSQSSTGCSRSAVEIYVTFVAVLDMASSTTGTSPLSSMLPSAHVLAMRRTRWARGQQAAARLQETLSKFFLALGVLLCLLSASTFSSTSAFSFWSLVLSGACPTLRGTSCSMRSMAMVTRMLRRWRTQARRS